MLYTYNYILSCLALYTLLKMEAVQIQLWEL